MLVKFAATSLRRCPPSPPPHCFFHSLRAYAPDARWPGWQVIIGIETHAQIKSRQKLFSNAPTSSSLLDAPNTHVVPFDAALPGTLPQLNSKCVDLAIRTAVALGCDVQRRSSFDRKHYFYSDLPAGYQITQQYAPIALNGHLNITLPTSPTPIPIRIKQIQLEQDTAKSTFNPRTRTSHIDLNRAGTGLMEIVSYPDIRSPEEAAAYVRTLQAILRSVGSSDGNMEQGSMRCDVNVSVNRAGEPPGTRCEIKNLNSVRFMVAAITHEVSRQRALLTAPSKSDGTTPLSVPQETRGFDENTFETYKLRSKEEAPDYRYMPDLNLGVLVLSEARIQNIRETLPELPVATRARLLSSYGLSTRDVDILLGIDNGGEVGWDGEPLNQEEVGQGSAVKYFDQVCKRRNAKIAFNWMTHELLGQLTARKEGWRENTVSAVRLGGLIDLVVGGVVTGTSGKYLLRHLLANPATTASPSQIAEELKLTALSPSSIPRPSSSSASFTSHDNPDTELHRIIQATLATLPSEVAALRAGHTGVMNKIVGAVMKATRGRADARGVKALVEGAVFPGEADKKEEK